MPTFSLELTDREERLLAAQIPPESTLEQHLQAHVLGGLNILDRETGPAHTKLLTQLPTSPSEQAAVLIPMPSPLLQTLVDSALQARMTLDQYIVHTLLAHVAGR